MTPRPQASGHHALQQLYPKRVGGGYEFMEDLEGNPLSAPGAVSQALRALPALTHPYSQYDLDLLAEILRHGDAQAHKEACSGNGSGEVHTHRIQSLHILPLPENLQQGTSSSAVFVTWGSTPLANIMAFQLLRQHPTNQEHFVLKPVSHLKSKMYCVIHLLIIDIMRTHECNTCDLCR